MRIHGFICISLPDEKLQSRQFAIALAAVDKQWQKLVLSVGYALLAWQEEPMTEKRDIGQQRVIEPTAARIAALKSDPQFTAAVLRFAEAVASHYRNRWLLNRLLNDRGRFLLAFLALDLHYNGEGEEGPPGLTAGRLKAACVTHGVCSAGRAGSVLATMRLFGLLAEARGRDGRERLLIPTERLLTIHRERWRKVFAAVAVVLPEGEAGASNLANERFIAAFVRELMLRFRAGLRPLDWAPELSVFAERDGGMMIALQLLAAYLAKSEGLGGQAQADLTIAGIAQRYSVSRAHVLGMLRSAEAAGLIRRMPDNRILVTPQMVDSFDNFFAGIILLQGDAIRSALSAAGSVRPRTVPKFTADEAPA
ncbi:hypothetical protein CHELA1G11_12393 [Hyphomicrobiales bacterium]|nr:hypothetical protein CHELA1G2_11916 [Hyphomicrobiales bacterium]CAH1664529.1 hypothetical protein CHELA1G11_12393 [Hyphomicrobiales bacterium]